MSLFGRRTGLGTKRTAARLHDDAGARLVEAAAVAALGTAASLGLDVLDGVHIFCVAIRNGHNDVMAGATNAPGLMMGIRCETWMRERRVEKSGSWR